MFVGFYEVGVEMKIQGKRTVSTIQVELWDLDVLFFVGGFNVLCLWGFMR